MRRSMNTSEAILLRGKKGTVKEWAVNISRKSALSHENRILRHPRESRETIMATLNITLPDAMMEFLDRKIGTGRFKDASVYLQLLIAEAMDSPETDFTE